MYSRFETAGTLRIANYGYTMAFVIPLYDGIITMPEEVRGIKSSVLQDPLLTC